MEALEASGDLQHMDFLYVCVNFADRRCIGQAYLNFLTPRRAAGFLSRWQSKPDVSGIVCNRGRKQTRLNVVFANRQGFDACVLQNKTRHIKDRSLKAWVRPDMEERQRALEAGRSRSAAGSQQQGAPSAAAGGVAAAVAPAAAPRGRGQVAVPPQTAAVPVAGALGCGVRPPPGLELMVPGNGTSSALPFLDPLR